MHTRTWMSKVLLVVGTIVGIIMLVACSSDNTTTPQLVDSNGSPVSLTDSSAPSKNLQGQHVNTDGVPVIAEPEPTYDPGPAMETPRCGTGCAPQAPLSTYNPTAPYDPHMPLSSDNPMTTTALVHSIKTEWFVSSFERHRVAS